MTEQELAAIEARAELAHECWPEHTHHYKLGTDTKALIAEVRRLRGLVARVEWINVEGDNGCPWCAAWEFEKPQRHMPSCPAFSAPGVVR